MGIHVGDIFCTLESPLLLKPKRFQNFLDKIDGIKSVFSYDLNSFIIIYAYYIFNNLIVEHLGLHIEMFAFTHSS